MAERRSCDRAKSVCNGAKTMTDAAYVTDARNWAQELVRRETRGPGDQENAMRRLEARYGIPWRTFWSLKYRPPTDVFVSVYNRLHAAYRAECERQMRLLKHEIEITKAKVGASSHTVASAEAFVAQIQGGEE
jgi:hypothetical protein